MISYQGSARSGASSPSCTYASIRAAAGDNPIYIAEQLGHEDPAFTFRVYQRAVKRRDRLEGNYLEAFDRALEWAAMGSGATRSAIEGARVDHVDAQKPHQKAIIEPQGR